MRLQSTSLQIMKREQANESCFLAKIMFLIKLMENYALARRLKGFFCI